MLLKEVMKRIISVPHNITITEAARIMGERNIGSVPVEKNKDIIGIVTERDILKKIVAKEKNPALTRIEEIITPHLITLDVNDDIIKANNVMNKHNIRRLLVTENEKVVGIITLRDISRYLRFVLAQRILSSKEEDIVRNIY